MEFQRSDRAHYARGRRTKREAVNRNMSRDPGSRAADQGAVWEDIDAKMATMSARSDTGAMSDIYEQHRGSLDDYVVAFGQQPGQVGAVFMVGTTFAGVDLFAHEATFAGLLPKLARSYALDAMELNPKTPFKPPKASAQRLVADVVAAQARAYPAVGVGPGRAHREPDGRRWGAGGGRRRVAPGGVPPRRAGRGPARVRRLSPRQPAPRGTACGGSDVRDCPIQTVSGGDVRDTACRKPPRPGKVALSPTSWLIDAIGFRAIAGVVAGHHRRWTP